MKRSTRFALYGALAVAALMGGAEVAVRLTGVANFPIYRADSEIGYILAPGQQGMFLNKNRWIFNDKSQGARSWKPGEKNLLLLGDSIVLGGNPLDQSVRLGPQLQDRLVGWDVWPASAGSWSAANEVVYLHRFPEVVQRTQDVVWVLNSGDLDGKSVWKSELTHPRAHPWSAFWYAFSKYVLLPRMGKDPEAQPSVMPRILPQTEEDVRSTLQDFRSRTPPIRVLFVLYPTRDELLGNEPVTAKFYEEFRQALAALAETAGAAVLEVRRDPRWTVELYRDGIHPNARGNEVLATLIAEKLHQSNML